MTYIDGFVAAVKADQKDAYMAHAKKMVEVFKDHGVTRVVDTWGDDIPDGEMTSFPMAVKAEVDEVVVLSWLVWPSRDARMAGVQKIMTDPRITNEHMPFDGKRMIWGGFDVFLDE